MIIPQIKKPIIIKSIEQLIEKFDRAASWINDNLHRYTEDAITVDEDEDVLLLLQRVTVDFLGTEENHYFCFAERQEKCVVIFQLNIDKAIVLNKNQIIICTNDAHQDALFISLVFQLYGKDDRTVRLMPIEQRTFDMADSIHKKGQLHSIELISK